MHPLLLGGLIVGGLLLIDVLLRFAGNRGVGRLDGEADAIAQFHKEYSEIDAADFGRVVLTSDRRNAFFAIGSNGVGFVRGLGDRFVVRHLGPSDIVEMKTDGDKVIVARFNDVTLRRLRFEFASSGDRDLVTAMLRTA